MSAKEAQELRLIRDSIVELVDRLFVSIINRTNGGDGSVVQYDVGFPMLWLEVQHALTVFVLPAMNAGFGPEVYDVHPVRILLVCSSYSSSC